MKSNDSSHDWPKWAIEPVEVVPYDPRWQARAETEMLRLTQLLAPWITRGLHHVGSTAVLGLAAKPILDLMGGVENFEAEGDMEAALAPEGWHYVPPDLDDRAFRRFFVKVKAGRRYAHLHLIRPSDARWSEQLEFRDRLRADSELAMAYGELKRTLATEHSDDREAYTHAKSDFIRSVLESSH